VLVLQPYARGSPSPAATGSAPREPSAPAPLAWRLGGEWAPRWVGFDSVLMGVIFGIPFCALTDVVMAPLFPVILAAWLEARCPCPLDAWLPMAPP
jgi:hypothetical protein